MNGNRKTNLSGIRREHILNRMSTALHPMPGRFVPGATHVTRPWMLVFLLLPLLSIPGLRACPWCATNALQKPTVFEGEPDPGGTFFGKIPDPKLTLLPTT